MDQPGTGDAANAAGTAPTGAGPPGERPLWRRKTADELHTDEVRQRRRQRFNPFQPGPFIVGAVIGAIPVGVLLYAAVAGDAERDAPLPWLFYLIFPASFYVLGFVGA